MSENLESSGPTYRVPRGRGMDAGTKRLAIIAGGLGGALLLIVGAWSMMGHRGGQVPVIEADGRPLRIKPANPGGMQVAGANDEILSGDAGAQADKLLPPPETPEPRALRTQDAAQSKPAPAAAGVPAPPPAVATPDPKAATVPPPAKVAAATPAQGKAATASAGSGRTIVQLAALDSEQGAHAEWQRLARRMPDILGGKQPAVVKVERDGHTIWRLRTGGFADIAQATAFCEKVRAKGAGCSIASF